MRENRGASRSVMTGALKERQEEQRELGCEAGGAERARL